MPNILDGAVIGAAIGANEETITILKKDYDNLLKDSELFNALDTMGIKSFEQFISKNKTRIVANLRKLYKDNVIRF